MENFFEIFQNLSEGSARSSNKMANGFMSFVLGAVFLLALVSSGALISGQLPDYSYEKYRSLLVSEVAIKQSYYYAVSEASSTALNASLATNAAPQLAIMAAALARSLQFESQLNLQGYDVVFWCGEVSEESRQLSSLQMADQKKALAPEGTKPLLACAGSFDANLLTRKVHFYDLGFSFYSTGSGFGKAAVLPSSYEVGF